MIRQVLCISAVLLAATTARVEAQRAPAGARNQDRTAEPAVSTGRKDGETQAPARTGEDPAVDTSPSSSPAPSAAPPQSTAPAEQGAAPAAGTPRPRKFRTMDRLDLDPSAITGNQELPKVLYIVPWKKAELGDVAGKPTNSLLDEVLTPVDRDVFRRQTEYFSKLESGANAAQGGPKSADPKGPEQGQGGSQVPQQTQQQREQK